MRKLTVGHMDIDSSSLHHNGTTSGTTIALMRDPPRIVYANHAHGVVHYLVIVTENQVSLLQLVVKRHVPHMPLLFTGVSVIICRGRIALLFLIIPVGIVVLFE